jgi:hypothetical protein
VVLLQDDGRPLFLRQLLHRDGNRLAQLVAGNQILDGFDRALFGCQLDDVHTLGRRHDRRALLAPDPVAAEVERDAVEPRRELRLALEAGQRPESTQEGFLDDVPGVLVPADDPVGQGINRPFPSKDELIEAIRIARDRPGHELFVRPRHLREHPGFSRLIV